MSDGVILDTGPLVAFMDKAERHHAWAVEQFKNLRPPLLTCEPVLTECLFLLRRLPRAQDTLLDLVARGVLIPEFRLKDHAGALLDMHSKYRNIPMSLADACLVRMAEATGLPICTLDSDFTVYRTGGGRALRVIRPPA